MAANRPIFEARFISVKLLLMHNVDRAGQLLLGDKDVDKANHEQDTPEGHMQQQQERERAGAGGASEKSREAVIEALSDTTATKTAATTGRAPSSPPSAAIAMDTPFGKTCGIEFANIPPDSSNQWVEVEMRDSKMSHELQIFWDEEA